MLRELVGTDAGLARSRLDILAADGLGYVLRRHIVGGKAVGVEPDTHGVVAASHDFHQTDSINTLQFAKDVDVGKVIDELLGVRRIRTEDVEVHQHTVYLLLGNNAGTDNFLRQFVQDGRYAVLHIDGRHIGVGPYLEVNCSQ